MNQSRPGKLVHVEQVWDTAVSVHLHGPAERLEPARAAIVALLHHVDDVFSTFRPDSVICRWHRQEITPTAELAEVLALAGSVSELTAGLFDLGWNGLPDPTGLVKGWAADRAVELALRHGIHDLQVNAGGDVRTAGSPGEGRPWRVGVSDPFDPRLLAAVVVGHDLCLATSGVAQRGQHIVIQGDPVIVSASVLGPDLATADGLATAAVAAGRSARELMAGLDAHGWSSLLIDRDGSTWRSAGWSEQTTEPAHSTDR